MLLPQTIQAEIFLPRLTLSTIQKMHDLKEACHIRAKIQPCSSSEEHIIEPQNDNS